MTTTKIDLDDLERKATAVPFGEPPAPIDDAALTQQAAGYHDFNAIESMACELRHRRHKQVVIDAVPALIARIRELESAYGQIVDDHVRNESDADTIAMQALLDKGAVLP